MPVTLAQASLNTTDDIDTNVIDEFRKESVILDSLIFDDVVNPSGGGSTLTYGYTRLITQPSADFRAINSEYTPSEVTKERETVDLKVLGGSFQIDRVLADLARGAETTLQMRQKIKATRTRFGDEVVNGDTAVDAEGFDGLDKILAGTDTEMNADGSEGIDWTNLDASGAAHGALDTLDAFLALLDGPPTLVLGNRLALAKVRGIARRSGQYVREPIEGLLGQNGRPIVREAYGSVIFVDPGEKAGSNQQIIPVYDPDHAVFVVTNPDGADGGTFKFTVTVGDDADESTAIAFGATGATIDTAAEALDNVPAGGVAVTGGAGGPWTFTFGGELAGRDDITVTITDQSVTDGGVPENVTVAESGTTGGYTDLYAVRIGLDGFHGVTTVGSQLVKTWLPDFTKAGAVKTGEVEMGPVAVALKATKAAGVLRRIKVR